MLCSSLIALFAFGAVFIISSLIDIKRRKKPAGAKEAPVKAGATAAALIRKAEAITARYTPKPYLAFSARLIEKGSLEDRLSPQRYTLFQVATFAVIFILFSTIFGLRPANALLVATGSGFLLPHLALSRIARCRKERIVAALPYFADILTLSCEAGMDIFASLLNIIENSPKGPLKEELEQLLKWVRIGKSRHEALKEAYRRSDIWDLKTIYLTIMQSETLGTPLGRSLRSQVEMMRNTRMNRAERAAQEAPLKLMIPLVIFIFPVTFIVLIAPIAIRLMSGDLI